MKKTTLIVTLIIFVCSIAHADTIDYWQVFYNKEKIKEGVEFSLPEIVIKTITVKDNDSLTIKYFCDACYFDSTMLYYASGDKKEYLLAQNDHLQFFRFTVSFSIKQLLENNSSQSGSFIEIFFSGAASDNKNRYKRPVLKVKFEK